MSQLETAPASENIECAVGELMDEVNQLMNSVGAEERDCPPVGGVTSIARKGKFRETTLRDGTKIILFFLPKLHISSDDANIDDKRIPMEVEVMLPSGKGLVIEGEGLDDFALHPTGFNRCEIRNTTYLREREHGYTVTGTQPEGFQGLYPKGVPGEREHADNSMDGKKSNVIRSRLVLAVRNLIAKAQLEGI